MRRSFPILLASSFFAVFAAGSASAQGIIQQGAGATHLSMAGASTAMGVDAAGALYWNPAVISGLPGSEAVIGAEMLVPDLHLGSTVPAGAFGPLPLVGQSGLTRSDSGVVPVTDVAVVMKSEDSPLTLGLGLMSLAAGGVNFPGTPGNPILDARGPLKQFILGPEAASVLILGIEPTVSYQLTDRLAIGMGPMVDVTFFSVDPAFFGPPSQLNPLAPSQFPTGSHTRPFWGGGFRAGLTYKAMDHLVAGFSYTSKQWFEDFQFNARDANGNPLSFSTPFSLPQIISLGAAYDGIDHLLLATDVRWFNYSNTDLLGTSPINGGAGWRDVWAVACGARYCVSDRLSAQLGYLFNTNPVPSNLNLFNTELPLINMHTISVGANFQMNEWVGFSAAYVHGFKNTETGSLVSALGTSVTLGSTYDAFVFGMSIKFGGPSCKDTHACQPQVSSGDSPILAQ
jgi:long-chain fatty acid transport protein